MGFYIIGGILVLGVLIGISLMSRASTARIGNALSAVCTAAAIIVTLYSKGILSDVGIWVSMGVGIVLGLIGAARAKMIQMPQIVALLNGLGGASSAFVAILSVGQAGDKFSSYTAAIALVVGFVTFTGSVVAAGKLHRIFPQKPVVWKGHTAIIVITLILLAAAVVAEAPAWLTAVLASFFGIAFAIRVGGADMPITISLLKSLSGVAGGIAGIAVCDPLLVAIGGIVGASGLLLTQIMCRAMNRRLINILLGSSAASKNAAGAELSEPAEEAADNTDTASEQEKPSAEEILANAKKVFIVPGYGMALAQAQSKVKMLADRLEERGAEVKYAIHPVAGRMPGHMNVLLCEVDVPYDKLFEMEAINSEFAECDVTIVVGANDVVNPAANTAEGTPIYGMPVLNVAESKYVIICNYDENPGYAGVPNPLYKSANTIIMLGDAKETVGKLIAAIGD